MLNPLDVTGGHRDDGSFRIINRFDDKAVARRPDNLSLDGPAASEIHTYGRTRRARLLDGRPPIAAGGCGKTEVEKHDASPSTDNHDTMRDHSP